jgi:hypothetical protein
MADSMKDWLGPLIEYELNHAINWRRRASATNEEALEKMFSETPVEQIAVSDKLDGRRFKGLYKDDGSNLWANVKQSIADAKAIQLLQVRRHFTFTSLRICPVLTDLAS